MSVEDFQPSPAEVVTDLRAVADAMCEGRPVSALSTPVLLCDAADVIEFLLKKLAEATRHVT